MDKNEINKAIEKFMHPTVFTGVKPIFLVAEELATKDNIGDIIDAVWIDWNNESDGVFNYITKFAVKGKITNRYNSSEELEAFCDRLALPTRDNLEKMILHRMIKQEIEDVKAKQYSLVSSVQNDFDNLIEIVKKEKEVSFFKKWNREWTDTFSDINIDVPYKIIYTKDNSLSKWQYNLQHPKTGLIEKYSVEKEFYAYIVGGKADIVGLKLKDESYKKRIEALKDKARSVLKSIEWLYLKNSTVKSIKVELPKYPFDNYFKYVQKGDERKLQAPKNLVKALEIIIAKHMPDKIGPMGVEYIPIDNLLYLFHEVIPRIDALLALEACDVIHEPAGLLLGYDGKRELPPKFLVSLPHVAYAYKKFPSFIEACERYLV